MPNLVSDSGKKIRLFSNKKVVVFDLDGTLTESKTAISREMASLFCRLLAKKRVAVMGGGNHSQFKNQFLSFLACPKENYENLFILPVSGGSFYKFHAGKWKLLYEKTLSLAERKKILSAFEKSLKTVGYSVPKKVYGKIIEDRGSQITFSALGQKAPVKEKEKWNIENNIKIRGKLRFDLKKRLPGFEVRMGGLTSVDVTKKGIDKAYGINMIIKLLKVSKKDIVYVGDALYRGGNDSAVKKTGVDTIQVKDEKETKKIIQGFLSWQK